MKQKSAITVVELIYFISKNVIINVTSVTLLAVHSKTINIISSKIGIGNEKAD